MGSKYGPLNPFPESSKNAYKNTNLGLVTKTVKNKGVYNLQVDLFFPNACLLISQRLDDFYKLEVSSLKFTPGIGQNTAGQIPKNQIGISLTNAVILECFEKYRKRFLKKNNFSSKGPPFGFLGICPTVFWPIPGGKFKARDF